MDDGLRLLLLALIAEDERVRERLAADGSLFEGYHPEMEAVHRANAGVLRQIVSERGWPGRPLVGGEGAEAAFRILQHSIGEPQLQRQGLVWLREAVDRGEAEGRQLAMLTDRVRVFEGKPQLYGTQFDWQLDGELGTGPIEEAENLDERRAEVGLVPFSEALGEMHKAIAASNEPRLEDIVKRQREIDEWARRVGWR